MPGALAPQQSLPLDRRELPEPPPPPEPGVLEQTAASFRTAIDATPFVKQSRLREAYAPVVREVTALTGKRTSAYLNPWALLNPFAAELDRKALWRDIAALQAQGHLTEVKPQELFEREAQGRDGGHDADAGVAAEAGWLPWLAGSIAASFADPINVGAGIASGGLGTGIGLARGTALNVASNALAEAAELPLTVDARRSLGEEVGPGDMALDVAVAGAFGGAFHLGGRAAGKAVDRFVPTELRVARALAQAVPADSRTAIEKAAINVLVRDGEIDAVNPFLPDGAGTAAHDRGLGRAFDRLLNPYEPASAPRPRPPGAVMPREPGGPAVTEVIARQGGLGKLHRGIVDGLRGRGFQEHIVRGVAAGIEAESRSNPGIVNPTSGAFGIGQWLGPRKRALFAKYGPNPTLEQQLDFLAWELRGGDFGGKAVLGQGSETAVLDAYIRKFMRPAPGGETSGDLSRGMAALGRDGERVAAADDVAGEAPPPPDWRPELDAAEARLDADKLALEAERAALLTAGRQVPLESFAPDEIGVDAALMQFKSGGDARGVTERLRGVEQWDPIAANVVTVWESVDGRRLIADGHQRLALAQRLREGDPNVRLNAYVLREGDGYSASDARLLTALKNIGEGTGSATDAAKVFRQLGSDSPEVRKRLPPRSPLVRDGQAIARLSPDAFGAVVNEVVPEDFGVAVGALAPDAATHAGLLTLLRDLDPANRRQAEGIVRQALDAGFSKETQDELFGARELVTSRFAAKARLLDKSLGELRRLKGAFGVAARNKGALESAGNVIDEAASAAEAAGNARALDLVGALAYRKGNRVSELLNAAVERLEAGDPVAAVVRDFVADLRKLDLNDLERSADDGGAGGGAGAPGAGDVGIRSEARADDEAGAALPLDEPAPLTRDEVLRRQEAQADQLAMWDAPAAPIAREQAGSLLHDLKQQLDQAGEGEDLAVQLDAEGGPIGLADLLDDIAEDAAIVATIRGCL